MLKEDAEFLERLKSDLEHRYTEKDGDYMQTCTNELPNPPILKIIVERRPSYYEDGYHRDFRRGRHFRNRKHNSFHPYRRDNNHRYDRNESSQDGSRGSRHINDFRGNRKNEQSSSTSDQKLN